MASTKSIVLHSFCYSSCAWRVRLALNLKNIKYETEIVDLLHEGQFSPAFLKVNPMGHVPALQIDGLTLIESMNILHYLEETRPNIPLMPKEPAKRAQVREICEIVTSGVQPLQNLSVLQKLPTNLRKSWPQHWISRGLIALEKLLEKSSGKYCVGDDITMADCCLIPQFANARRFEVDDLTKYFIINKIEDTLKTHPAFVAAHPTNQPDSIF